MSRSTTVSKPCSAPPRTQRGCVPGPAGPEVEVLSDDDGSRLQLPGKQIGAEILSAQRRQAGIEGQQDEFVRPDLVDQADPLGQWREELRHTLGVDDRQRVTIEAEDGARDAPPPGHLDGALDGGTMASVHAVERPDGEGSGTVRQAGEAGEAGDDLHHNFTSSLRAWPSSDGP